MLSLRNEKLVTSNWSNIELQLTSSLTGSIDQNGFSWERVFSLFDKTYLNETLHGSKRDEATIASLIFDRCHEARPGVIDSKDCFCSYLLEQLKLMEKEFGTYISKQVSDDKEAFSQKASILMEKLKYDESTLVVSFNYTDCGARCLRNLHGTCSNPIFGIDDGYLYSRDKRQNLGEERLKLIESFTKARRRLDLCDAYPQPVAARRREIVVYGHSLMEQDDAFFFQVFDQAQFRSDPNSSFTFAYSYFGDTSKQDRDKETRDSVFDLFKRYDLSRGFNSSTIGVLENNRRLSFQVVE